MHEGHRLRGHSNKQKVGMATVGGVFGELWRTSLAWRVLLVATGPVEEFVDGVNHEECFKIQMKNSNEQQQNSNSTQRQKRRDRQLA